MTGKKKKNRKKNRKKSATAPLSGTVPASSGRRRGAIIALALLLLAAAVVAGLLLRGRDTTAPPDVILISVDTLRRDRLPIYGYQHDTAPALTRLASSSVVFDNAISSSVNTAPSHATMLTGLQPNRHGLVRNRGVLSAQVATLGELLQTAGYATAAFVSGFTMTARTGLNRGFEHYDDHLTSPRERLAAETAAQATRWIQSAPADRPMFLFFHLFDPHYPYSPPEEFGRRFVPAGTSLVSPSWKVFSASRKTGLPTEELPVYSARYDGEICYADHHVGELLRLLEQRGRLARSLVIFTSDHGETLQERWHPFDHGCRLHDEQIRVPLVIQLPGGEQAGRRVGHDVLLTDLVPTVLDALGLDLPDGLDGQSLLTLARGAAPRDPERAILSYARADQRRVPGFDVPFDHQFFVTSLRRPPYKLIAYPTRTGSVFQLFNLREDPGEREDVSARAPEVVKSYWRELAEWSSALSSRGRPQVVPPSAEETLRSLGYVQ